MKIFLFLIFILNFNLYVFINSEWNWDDDFITQFYDIPKIVTMVNQCKVSPKSYETIDNLCEAIQHYKKKSGKNVKASSNLIEHMKEFDVGIFNDAGLKSYNLIKEIVKNSILKKIKDEKKKGNKKATIKNTPGSFYSAWYLTLGSYQLNIEYEENVDLSKTKFYFNIHFWGEDLWDFEEKDCDDEPVDNLKCILHNIFEEKLPGLIVGDGEPFNVEYDFYDRIQIDMNINVYNQNKTQIKTNISNYLIINISLIIILLFLLI